MIDIKVFPVGRVAFVDVIGRLDSMNAPQLNVVLERELRNERSRLILDLAGVEYMSAAGLRVLKSVFDRSGVVHIARPSARVREIMQITGLDHVYRLHESRINAIHTLTPVTNAHTHLELGWLANYCPDVTGAPFIPWIEGLIERRIALGERLEMTLTRAAEAGIRALADAGTTTVGDITTTGASIAPLLESGLRGVVYVEVLSPRENEVETQMNHARALIDRWRPKERHGMRIGLSLHAPYSVHPKLWKLALDYARREALPLCIHAAESPAEREFFLHASGPLVEFQKQANAGFASPRKTPIHYLEDLGALELKPLLVHAVEVDDDDVKRIKASGCTVVHCPRSNLRLQGGRMPLEKYVEQGVPVLLGTDGLCSSPSLNVLEEVEVAAALHHGRVKPDIVGNMVHQPL